MVHHKAIGMQLICISSLGQPLNTTAQPTTSFQGVSELSLFSGCLLTRLRDSRPPRQVNITRQCFQTQTHLPKVAMVNSGTVFAFGRVLFVLCLWAWQTAGKVSPCSVLALSRPDVRLHWVACRKQLLWGVAALHTSVVLQVGFVFRSVQLPNLARNREKRGSSLCVLVLGFVYHRRTFAYTSLPW